jgi:predicted transcriptional regulator of viral defense system
MFCNNSLMSRSASDEVLAFIRAHGVVRPVDLEAVGFSRMWLTRLQRRGLIERVRRGLYVAADAEWTEHHSLTEVARQVPGGVVCLLSALSYHGLTTQIPFEVWLAIDRKAWLPVAPSVPTRVMRFSGAALTSGVEEHVIEGVPVRIYGPAKTVVDCFRYRNKIGFDVALEALRDCHRLRLATVNELWECANRLRVGNVMRPYIESLL